MSLLAKRRKNKEHDKSKQHKAFPIIESTQFEQ